MRRRFDNLHRIESLDPQVAAAEIYALTAAEEFPWDVAQSLGLALFRTYAIPSIGTILAATGEFTERTQKRYDDTVLLMDAALDHGMGHPRGLAAVRRMNQMHRAYGISNEDMLYVLCTFIVVPIRWIDAWGWRPTTDAEREASARIYSELGRHMAISFTQSTFAEFADFMDAYERAHFGYSVGGHAVAQATLGLLTTFRPFNLLPGALARRLALALLDQPLLDALGLATPTRAEQVVVRGAFRARARIERWLPPRRRPRPARDLSSVRTYPRRGREHLPIEQMGTFPGCPVTPATPPEPPTGPPH